MHGIKGRASRARKAEIKRCIGHEIVAVYRDAGCKSGDNADLKNWASQTLPHLKERLSMAEKLK
jgi:hypothetical protein